MWADLEPAVGGTSEELRELDCLAAGWRSGQWFDAVVDRIAATATGVPRG